jgi:hypothetical protein
MDSLSDRLIFAWWNTGLSPPGGRPRDTDHDFQVAANIVKVLLQEYQVDFLGLGEVTKFDLDRLTNDIRPSHYSLYDGTLKEGRLQFDTGAIFNLDCFKLIDHFETIERHGLRQLKLANRVDLMASGDSQSFHVYITHWPSHLVPDSESLRIHLGSRLRSALAKVLATDGGDARVILMGDFNEEPFHECLDGQLLATRDRSIALKSEGYLYNPFWRFLGESQPYSHLDPHPSFAGTCYVASGNRTKWKTVDQIIVSSTFLGRSSWHLNEHFTRIIHPPFPNTALSLSGAIFDHFPVIMAIEKFTSDQGGSHA